MVTVDVGRARRVAVTGAWAGDSTAASARASIDVNFDAPFVTPELVLPGEGVTLGDDALEAVITVRVGEVQTLSPGAPRGAALAGRRGGAGAAVPRRGRHRRRGARGAAGARRTRFGPPGVARLVPRVDLGNGRVVEGVGRELLVRGRVAISLLRAETAEEGEGVTLHGAVVLTTGDPVPNAALRIVQGERTLAATRADAQGGFRLVLGPEVLTEPGMSARAIFEPTEPWYLAAESPEVELTAPPTPPIHWSWGAAPVALAALAVGVMSLRRRAVRRPRRLRRRPPWRTTSRCSPTAPPARSACGSSRSIAPLGARVSGCRVRVDDGAWQGVGAEPVAVGEGATVCQLTLEASGYAPRRLRMDLPRGGEVRVQVAMRTWREELFARIRPWLENARRADVLPTPRELSQAGAVAHVAPAGEARGTRVLWARDTRSR